MQALSADRLLRAWELGRDRHPIDRGLLLHALAEPDADPDALADQPLGQRNRALFALRAATFGRQLPAWLDCPACGERLELSLDTASFDTLAPPAEGPVEVAGLRLRLPTSRDLAALAGDTSADGAALRLLEHCLITAPGAPTPALAPLLDAASEALEQADPWADLLFASTCGACGHAWDVRLDIAAFLWEELDAHAQRLLDEVHLLASAYGWPEADILALSAPRRAAYLQRVEGVTA